MRARERGMSLLIPALLLITVGAFAAVVAATQSGGDIQSTDAQADGVEALLLAESGLERAIRRFRGGANCSAAGLGETLANLTSLGLGTSGRSIAITAGSDSDRDFAGGGLASTQCRIQVTATIARSGASRTLQAILDRTDNLIGTPLVAGFDDPSGTAAPASWSGGYYDYTGGVPTSSSDPPNCTRSAYAVKARNGGGSAESAGSAPVAFTVSRPVTLLLTFDYRMFEIGNGNSNNCTSNSGGGSCPGSRDPDSPEFNGDGEICFALRDTAGNTYDSTRAEVDRSENLPNSYDVNWPSCTPTSQQNPTHNDFEPCDDHYNESGNSNTGRATVRFTFGGGGTLSFERLGYRLYISDNQATEMWIDNLHLEPSGGAIGGIAEWRDCSVTACPPT